MNVLVDLGAAAIRALQEVGPGPPDIGQVPGPCLFFRLCCFCDSGHVFWPVSWKAKVMSSWRRTWTLQLSRVPCQPHSLRCGLPFRFRSACMQGRGSWWGGTSLAPPCLPCPGVSSCPASRRAQVLCALFGFNVLLTRGPQLRKFLSHS